MLNLLDNQITLARASGIWVATFNGPRAAEIEATFGCKALPTAFTANAKAGDVWKHIQKRWPDWQVGIKSDEFGPQTVLAFGAVVWMKPEAAH